MKGETVADGGKQDPASADRSGCPNCNYITGGGHVGEKCPDCKITFLTEMDEVGCPECDSGEFLLIEQEPPRSIRGPVAMAECTGCGRRARLDEEGTWW